jgi:hypothetical protein
MIHFRIFFPHTSRSSEHKIQMTLLVFMGFEGPRKNTNH